MRHLATIRQIKEICPIEGADKIEVAVVDGWECVVAKADGYKMGDKVVYIEVDSILPATEQFEFMKKYRYRVKTIKLRKQISQGLIIPFSSVSSNHEVGDDVTEELGITKYDPEAQKEQSFYKVLGSSNKIPWWVRKLSQYSKGRWILTNIFHRKITKYFPSWIKKTDEERIQNLPRLVRDIKAQHIGLGVTEKLDGTSATYFLYKGEFGVCSRNLWLISEDDSPYWEMAKKYHLKEVLQNMADEFGVGKVVLQGEIVGEGIQKNPLKQTDRKLYLFNVILDDKRIAQCNWSMVKSEGFKNIPEVPMLFYLGFSENQSIQEIVTGLAGEKSVINPKLQREGVVCRNYDKFISFKILNPEYLLKHEE